MMPVEKDGENAPRGRSDPAGYLLQRENPDIRAGRGSHLSM